MDKDISKQLTVSRNFKMTRNDKISVGEGLWVRHYEWRSAAPFPPPALPLTTPMSGWGWRTPGSKDLTLSSYPEALHVTSTWFLVQPTSPPPAPHPKSHKFSTVLLGQAPAPEFLMADPLSTN